MRNPPLLCSVDFLDLADKFRDLLQNLGCHTARAIAGSIDVVSPPHGVLSQVGFDLWMVQMMDRQSLTVLVRIPVIGSELERFETLGDAFFILLHVPLITTHQSLERRVVIEVEDHESDVVPSIDEGHGSLGLTKCTRETVKNELISAVVLHFIDNSLNDDRVVSKSTLLDGQLDESSDFATLLDDLSKEVRHLLTGDIKLLSLCPLTAPRRSNEKPNDRQDFSPSGQKVHPREDSKLNQGFGQRLFYFTAKLLVESYSVSMSLSV